MRVRRRSPHLFTRLTAMAACCLLVTAVAPAQETRVLGEDGKWEKQPEFPPDSPEGKLQQIRRLNAEGRGSDAEELADEWIKTYATHDLLDHAYYERGVAKVKQGDYFKSLFDFEFLLKTFPESPLFHDTLEAEYEIANMFMGGVKRKLWGMRFFPFGLPAEDEAEEILIRIQQRAPQTALGEKASLRLADYYYDTAEMEKAAAMYEIFLELYPHSPHRERVSRRVIQAGLATFKGPRFDPTGLLDSKARLEAYRRNFPAAAERLGADALLVRINESLALKALFNAEWYEKRDHLVSAAYLYRRVIEEFSDTAAAQEAIKRLERIDPKKRLNIEGGP